MNRYFLLSEKTLSQALNGNQISRNSSGSNQPEASGTPASVIRKLPGFGARSPLQELNNSLDNLIKTPELTDAERWEKYRQIFTKYFQLSNYDNNAASVPRMPLPGNITISPFPADDFRFFKNVFSDVALEEIGKILTSVITTLPKSLQNKGKNLLLHLSASEPFQEGYYSWNQKGELLHEGAPISRTNIIDLIDYAIRNRSNVSIPLGWDVFSTNTDRYKYSLRIFEEKLSSNRVVYNLSTFHF